MTNQNPLSNFPPHKGYTVYSEHSLNEVLALIPEAPDENLRCTLADRQVEVASPRLVNYKVNGVKCKTCGREGHVWRVESNGSKAHLNLYSKDGVMLAKDHIIPKSKGGSNTVENYQPMCKQCNGKKGNKMPVDALLGRRAVWIKPLVWFMSTPYQGIVVGAHETENGISVLIRLENGEGYFGWSDISNFQTMD